MSNVTLESKEADLALEALNELSETLGCEKASIDDVINVIKKALSDSAPDGCTPATKRSPKGKNLEVIGDHLSDHPGRTAKEISGSTGVSYQSVSASLRKGPFEKRERKWYAVP